MNVTSKRPLKLALIREGKVPPDSRVALTPQQAARVHASADFEVRVQPSPGRCFPDDAYRAAGVPVEEDLSDCDILIGVKEVPIDQLVPDKTYFFFSHTHKEQAYNRALLQAVISRGIRLIDYELLTDDAGDRLIAFGKFAGMVGAHHALRAWGLRTGNFELPQMNTFTDYEAAQTAYAKTNFGQVRVVVTGTGRVGKGAVSVLRDAGLTEVTNESFLAGRGEGAVFTHLSAKHYVQRRDGKPFTKREFYADPKAFESAFEPYTKAADVFVHGIFWDNDAPAMFTVDDMTDPAWRIQVISDVTCDIYPVTSVPATRKASTIAEPYFGFDPRQEAVTESFETKAVTMMTIDNLPNELPRDASKAFGTMFIEKILPELRLESSAVLDRATLTSEGALTPAWSKLEHFVSQK